MAIPESVLESWSTFVPSAVSKNTADSIKATLKAMGSVIRLKDFDVYLQGSYKNDTNLRGDSDVDVVVELKSTFSSNANTLPPDQYQTYSQTYSNATYQLSDFRRDVINTLSKQYGSHKVDDSGDKAIRLIGNPGSRLDADLLVCMEYRKYTTFYGEHSPYVPGVRFFTQRDGRAVVNYPNVHYKIGCDKHKETRDWFKKTVRTYKRARNRVVEKGWMQPKVAPSYFIECLLSNVPEHRFGGTHTLNFIDVLEWLERQPLTGFMSQNRELPLFGSTPEQWNEDDARRFLRELRDLWILWS